MKASRRDRGGPVKRSLSSGHVLRLKGGELGLPAKGVAETTKDVDIHVSFDEGYLKPEGTSVSNQITVQNRGPVKLVFGGGATRAEPEPVETKPVAEAKQPDVLYLENQAAPAPEPESEPEPAVAPIVVAPPPYPLRNKLENREQDLSGRERMDRLRRVKGQPQARLDHLRDKPAKTRRGAAFGLLLAAMVALGVFLPNQLENEPADAIFSEKEIGLAAKRSADARAAAKVEAAKLEATKSEAEAIAQAAAVSVPPKPDVAAPRSAEEVAVEQPVPQAVQRANFDQTLARAKLPPRPQKLVVPKVDREPTFVASRAVENPPDPNEMAVVPGNPFVEPPKVLVGLNATTELPSVSGEFTLAALSVERPIAPNQTDAPAVASPEAERPPAGKGPSVLTALREPLAAPYDAPSPDAPSAMPGLPKSPVKSDVDVDQSREFAFVAPKAVPQNSLIAAVILLRPEVPSLGTEARGAAPDRAERPVLSAAFKKPASEAVNSDAAIDPAAAIPAKRPERVVPQPTEGPVTVLTKTWNTPLDLELKEEGGAFKVAGFAKDAPDWLKMGATLSMLNGSAVGDIYAYEDVVNQACRDSVDGYIALEVTLGDGALKALDRLKCSKRVMLSNALEVEARIKRGKWRLIVVKAAEFGRSDLKLGDRLRHDYTNGLKLNMPNALEASLEAARAKGAQSIEFGIIRDGAIENAELGLLP